MAHDELEFIIADQLALQTLAKDVTPGITAVARLIAQAIRDAGLIKTSAVPA